MGGTTRINHTLSLLSTPWSALPGVLLECYRQGGFALLGSSLFHVGSPGNWSLPAMR